MRLHATFRECNDRIQIPIAFLSQPDDFLEGQITHGWIIGRVLKMLKGFVETI